jgi:cell division septation protein DedD
MVQTLMTENLIPDRAEEFRAEESADYEIVLGRRQQASVLFVATVAVVTFSALSYLAGKAASPKQVAPVAAVAIAPVAAPAAARALPIVVQPKPMRASAPEPPLFADPAPNAIYLQMGAVERGIAAIFAQGLRKEGLPSFVAPGPDAKIFRVLIGPLPDAETYRRVKDRVDAIGLTTFAKKYVN